MSYPLLTTDATGWFIKRLTAASLGRIGSRTPTDLETQMPFVRVLRIGGPDDGFALDIPTMAFHCFAATEQAARKLATDVRNTVFSLRDVVADGAVLTIARTLTGPTWAPSDNENVAHTVLLMQARITAAS